MKKIFLILPLILAALACSLTNEVRTTIDTGGTSTPIYLVAPQKTALPAAPTVTTSPTPEACTVTADALTLRAGAGVDFPALDYLTQGDPLTILESAAAWWKVQTPTGQTGYINSNYCERK